MSIQQFCKSKDYKSYLSLSDEAKKLFVKYARYCIINRIGDDELARTVMSFFRPRLQVNTAITLTFGEQSENHRGMQIIGQGLRPGFTYDELKNVFDTLKYPCLFVDLNDFLPSEAKNVEKACVLVIKGGVNLFVNASDLYHEQNRLNWDTKAYMYGRVVNKNARHNLCYDEKSQEPDYDNKKGRIIAYNDIPITKYLRENIHKVLGERARNLNLEGNKYFDSKNCGIGFHGDTERKIVIGVRLGANIPLRYRWFYNNKVVSKNIDFDLEHGDLYVMSEKATGYDWKRKSLYTLRHAAGCKNFIE